MLAMHPSLRAAFAALAFLPALALAQTTIKLGYPVPDNSQFGAGAIAFSEELEKRSNGRFKVQRFPASQLGGERQMAEGVQLGTVDMTLITTGPLGNFVPDTQIFDIPFLFRDYPHARAVMDGPVGREILGKFAEKGMIALAFGEAGFRNLTNSKRAVVTPEDLKGMKVRTMENPLHMQAFRGLGASPTPMAWPEVFGALQQGTVDGQETPIPVIVASKFWQVQKHVSLTRHLYSPAPFLLSPAVWNKLGAEDKAIFTAAAIAGVGAMRKYVDEQEANGVAELRANGMTVTTNVDTARFQEVLAPTYADFAKRFGKERIDRIRNTR